MDKALLDNIMGGAAALAICIGGAIYLWKHASKRSYDSEDLITVAEFASASDARLWRMRLESQGVRCITVGEIPASRANLGVGDLSAVRLQVLGCDVGRARRILGQS